MIDRTEYRQFKYFSRMIRNIIQGMNPLIKGIETEIVALYPTQLEAEMCPSFQIWFMQKPTTEEPEEYLQAKISMEHFLIQIA